MAHDPLQVAIIGCGAIGPVHAAAVQLDADASLRWACDRTATRLSRVAAQRSTTDVAEVLADPQVDLLCVCTPHPEHAVIVEAALAHGKHVLCEKPLGSTPDQVRRILAAAAAHPQLVTAGIFQHRHAPLARRLQQVIAHGSFGRIIDVQIDFACIRDESYYATDAWRGTRLGEGGGVALNQGIHTIDLGLWLAGVVPQRVTATVRRRRLACIEVEDYLRAEVEGADGIRAVVVCDNDGVRHWSQRIRICGERGTITLGDGHRLVGVEHSSQALVEELRALDAAHLEGRSLGGAKSVYGYHHALALADALEAVRTGRAPLVPVREAAVANLVVLAAYHAAAIAAPATLPLSGSYAYPILPLSPGELP